MTQLFRSTWFAIFFVLLASGVSAQVEPLVRGFLQLDYPATIDAADKEKPGVQLQVQYDWAFIRAFLHGEYADPALEQRGKALESWLRSGENQHAIWSEYELKRAIMAYYRGETWGVMRAIYTSYKSAKRAYVQNPEDPHARAVYGIFQYLVGSIPADYRTWFSMIGIEGEVRTGLGLMRGVAKMKPTGLLQVKTQLALAFFELQNPPTHANPPAAITDLPQSLMRTYLMSRFYYKSARPADSFELLQQVIAQDQTIEMPYSRLLMAKFALARQDWASAEKNLNEFEEQYTGGDYGKSVSLYRSWMALLRGNRPQYLTHIKSIGSASRAMVAEDIMAEYESKRHHHPALIRTRLALSYRGPLSAKGVLQEVDESAMPPEFKAEWWYLKGRIEQELTNGDLAIGYYRQVLQLNWDGQHFAPNALLQLARMEFETGESEKAIQFLDELESYEDYPYEASIKWQAKNLRNQSR